MDGSGAQTMEKGPSKTPVEEASREDLVKQVKRQLLLLQKAKAKCDELNRKCQERDGKIEELEEKCRNFEDVQSERDELQQAYLSLQGSQEQQFLSFQALEDQLTAANEDAVKWRRKFQDCVEKLECTESKMAAYAQGTECLREELRRLEEENKAYQQKVADLNEAKKEAECTIASLREQLEQLVQRAEVEEDAENASENAKQRIETLLAECEALKLERDEALGSKEMLSKELESVEVEKKQFMEQFSKLLEERALLENQRDVKMNECNLLQEEKHGLEKQVSDLYQAKEDLEAKEKEFAKILDENSTLEKSMAEAVEENTRLQHSLNDMQEKMDKLTAEHEALKRELTVALESRETSARLAEERKVVLEDAETKLVEKIEQVQMLHEELEVLRARKRTLDALEKGEGSQEAVLKIETLTTELEDAKKRAEEVLTEKRELSLALDVLREEEGKWKTEKEQLESEVLRVRQNYDALVEKLRDSAANATALERRLQDSLREKQNVVEELGQVRDLQQFLEDEAKELHRECERLKTEAKRLEADLENDHLHIQKLEQELEEAEIREHDSIRDLDALRCLVEELLTCIVELRNVLVNCKGSRVECTVDALSRTFERLSQLVVTASESGLVDINAEEFVQPCLAIPSLLENLAEAEEDDRQVDVKTVETLQEQLSIVKKRVEELDSRNKALEHQLSVERGQKADIGKDVAVQAETMILPEESLARSAAESEKTIHLLEKQVQELSGKVSVKEELLKTVSDDVSRLEELCNNLKKENVALGEEVTKLEGELSAKERSVCEEKNQYSQLQAQLAAVNIASAELEKKKDTLTEALALKQAEGDAMCKELKAKSEIILLLEQKLSGVVSESEETISSMKKQVEELKATLLMKEELFNAGSEKMDGIEQLCKALKIENDNLTKELSRLKTELAAREGEEDSIDLHTQLETLKIGHMQFEEENCRLAEALASEQSRSDALGKDLIARAEMISSLEEKLTTIMSESEERITSLENQIEELSGALSSKEEDLKKALENFSRAEELGGSLKLENARLVEEIVQREAERAERKGEKDEHRRLGEELEMLRTTNEELLHEKDGLKKALEASKAELNRVQENISVASENEEKLMQEISSLKERVSTLTGENATKSALVDEIHAKLDDLLDRSESLQEELDAKTRELDGYKLKLCERQKELDELLKELSECKGQLLKFQEEQEKVWDVIYPDRPHDSAMIAQFAKDFATASQWSELNRQLLDCILAWSQMTASDDSRENMFSDLYNALTAKLESFREEEADVFTKTRVEDVKLGAKALDALRQFSSIENSRDLSESRSGEDLRAEKLEELSNSVRERDEKLNKFKSLVVKLKRDLAEKNKQVASYEKEQISLKAELERQMQASKQTVLNFQSLQSEYDRLQDETEATKSLCKELEAKLTAVINDLATSKLEAGAAQAERDRLKQAQEVLTAEIKAWEQCKADLECKLLVAESHASASKEQEKLLKAQVKGLEEKLEEVNQQLQAEKESHSNTLQQLERVQKESKMQSLLHLEMADYERSVAELNAVLKEKSKELADMREEALEHQSKVSSLTEHIKHLDEQKRSDDIKIRSLKETVASLKEGLGASRRREEELVRAEVRLEADLRAAQLKEEEAKLEYAELSRKFQQLESSLRSTKENAQRNARALESKAALLQEQLAASRSELESTRTEFESYKTRVHTVLKQQKKSSQSSAAENGANGRLQTVVEQLRHRTEELLEELEARKAELEVAHEEYERLSGRHQRVVAELEMREKDWKNRIEEAVKKNTREMSLELERQLKQQHQKLESEFQRKLADQIRQHETAVEAQNELVLNLRRELVELQQPQQQPKPQEDAFDISLQERQEGEGSECATSSISIPVASLPWEVVPSSGFKPLEQLLTPDGDTEVTEDPVALYSKIAEAQKKLNHMSELLNESESSNLRLTEQVRVLKEEIRRLERNREREKHAENLEYLKNVVVKFATLKGGSEKERLIPVLTTMLRLSPEEQKQLQSVVSGPAESSTDAAASGWGGYLPRWPGLV